MKRTSVQFFLCNWQADKEEQSKKWNNCRAKTWPSKEFTSESTPDVSTIPDNIMNIAHRQQVNQLQQHQLEEVQVGRAHPEMLAQQTVESLSKGRSDCLETGHLQEGWMEGQHSGELPYLSWGLKSLLCIHEWPFPRYFAWLEDIRCAVVHLTDHTFAHVYMVYVWCLSGQQTWALNWASTLRTELF